MNERIKELADQALKECDAAKERGIAEYSKRFAELIVRECANTIEKFAPGQMDKEGEDWTNGYDDGLKTGALLIKEHFGVEE